MGQKTGEGHSLGFLMADPEMGLGCVLFIRELISGDRIVEMRKMEETNQ